MRLLESSNVQPGKPLEVVLNCSNCSMFNPSTPSRGKRVKTAIPNTLAVMLAVNCNKKPQVDNLRLIVLPTTIGFSSWLGCRDSNPNYLIQNQASYR